MARKKTSAIQPVGKRIKKVREGKNLSLDWMANETG